MNAELREARAELQAAIEKCDRLKYGDREPNEILTHWAVVYSHTIIDADAADDMTQVSSMRSDGMSYWQAAGLFQSEANVGFREPWDRDDDDL